MGLTQVMLVDENGTVYITPEMRKRIEFQQEVPKVVVSEVGE